MRIINCAILAFLSIFVCAAFAHADIIHLKNGNKVEGIILEKRENDIAVKLDIGMVITFSKDEIASIEESDLEEKETLERSWKEERSGIEEPPARTQPFAEETDAAKVKAPSNINWVHNFKRGMGQAKSSGKPAMIDFYTDWCGWCKKLDQDTYKDKEVLSLSTQFICIKIDADENKPLAKKYNVRGYPTILFLGPDGNELGRVAGYLSPGPFVAKMKGFLR